MDEHKIFGTKVTRDLLLNKISLLAMLGPIREGQQEYRLTSKDNPRRGLTIDQEGEIVRNLSFLAYRRKDPHSVVALCIEEQEDGEGMTVRFTLNGDNVSYVKEGLQQICSTLETISQQENTKIHDVELLFQKVVRLDISRISARLRLAKKYRIEASPIMQIYNVFLHSQKRTSNVPKVEEFRSQLTRIITLYRSLKGKPTPQRDLSALDAVEQIIKAAHHLSRCSEFFTALQDLSKFDAPQMELLKDLLDKLAHYYQACIELVCAARRERHHMFQRIQVEDFEVPVPSSVRAPSTPGSALSLIKTLKASSDTSKVLQRFHNSESKAAAALASRVDGTRSAIKIHAEIKLLFYYEVHPECVTPRVICANKSACYLCDLFLKIHGRFQVPMTFGKLNERWILPDWLDDIRADRLPALQRVVERFDEVLDVQIKRLLKGVKRMPDPKESAIGLPARWSASSIEDHSQVASHVGRVRIQSTTKSSEVHAIATNPLRSEQQAEMDYQRPKRLEVDPPTALDHLSRQQLDRFIRGHKSRSYEILSACGMAHLGGRIRRIDFHDLELFLESVYPSRGGLIALRCSEPTDLLAESFVDINKMKRGEEVILKFTEAPEGEKHMYLMGQGRSGTISWWKICWKRGLCADVAGPGDIPPPASLPSLAQP